LKPVGMVNGVQTYRVTFTTGVAGTTTFAIGNFGASGAAAISGTVDANTTGTGSPSLSGSAVHHFVALAITGGIARERATVWVNFDR
jgi:hypothetical protein